MNFRMTAGLSRQSLATVLIAAWVPPHSPLLNVTSSVASRIARSTGVPHPNWFNSYFITHKLSAMVGPMAGTNRQWCSGSSLSLVLTFRGRIEIGPQLAARDLRHSLNVQHPSGRNDLPLGDCLSRDGSPTKLVQGSSQRRIATGCVLGACACLLRHAPLKANLSEKCKRFFR